MSKPPGCFLFFLASMTFAGGCLGGGCVGASRTRSDKTLGVYAPLPHHIPPAPDAASFRFAMVHDVIHERYPRHGPAYYEERERLARENLAVLPRDSVTAFALTDDIAVGLDRRGRTDEAIALMRDKLKRQQALGLEGKDLYSTFANLGELLVRANIWEMCRGDVVARDRVREGREFIEKSLQVNPNAHFGRENWQLVALGYLLEAGLRPELIRKSDLIGNRLDRSVEFRQRALPIWWGDGDVENDKDIGRPYLPRWADRVHTRHRSGGHSQSETDEESRAKSITPVGGEARSGRRAPFDEPALWLVGEWRQGQGPNPHAPLCLGEIMSRVGQRYLAWSCYERSSRMADQFWPTASAQEFLRDHCRGRQEEIEKSLPAAEVAALRPRFESELAFGQNYQRDFQVYAEEKIRAGVNVNDPHFFDEFHAVRGPIASKVGPEEWYAGQPGPSERASASVLAFWQWGLLTGGACLLLAAIIATWIYRPRPSLGVTEITPPLSPAPESPPASSGPLH
jgi:hypothetical protein